MIRSSQQIVWASLFTVFTAGATTAPICKVPGCIEPNPAVNAPIGATLAYSRCGDEGNALNTYKYVRIESGWQLVSYVSERSKDCGPKDGA
jgi:hypothetical protein